MVAALLQLLNTSTSVSRPTSSSRRSSKVSAATTARPVLIDKLKQKDSSAVRFVTACESTLVS